MTLEHRRFAAVKVGLGMDEAAPSHEGQILKHIKEDQKPGYEFYITKLYEPFVIHDPNGYHECLVTEIVVNLPSFELKTATCFYPNALSAKLRWDSPVFTIKGLHIEMWMTSF